MASTLSRSQQTTFIGMVVAKDEPSGWAKDPVLVRFVQQAGANAVFHATRESKQQFLDLEMLRIYEIDVPPTVVRSAAWAPKNGVPSKYEVHVARQCAVRLSSTAWPLIYDYKFIAWDTINQLENDSYVDLIGIVIAPPSFVSQPTGTLRKATVEIASGPFQQTITLLGAQALLQANKGDVLAFASLVVKEYRQARSLQTTRLTMVQHNPERREGIPAVDVASSEEPRQKALKMTTILPIALSELPKLEASLQREPPNTDRTFQLVGTFEPFTVSFFEKDPPTTDIADRGLRMMWHTNFHDATGGAIVTVWDDACFSIFNLSAMAFRALWAEGEEDEQQRPGILDKLNTCLTGRYRCACSARLWKEKIQVNINLAEFLA